MQGPESKWGKQWPRILRVVVAVLAATLVVIQALDTTGAWKAPSKVHVGLAFAVGIAGLVEVVSTWIREGAQRSWEERKNRITKVIIGTLAGISDQTDQKIADMGASVLVVRKTWTSWHWPGRIPRRSEQLLRIVRFRLKDVPQASSVQWTAGKGCIGAAWKTKTGSYQHWGPTANKYSQGRLTEAKFNGLAEKTRGTFTFEEFREIVDKYAEIYAVPIMSEHGETVLGVLSVDRRFDPVTFDKRVLDPLDARATVEAAATAIRMDLE